MAEHEDRVVIGRVLAPPALPLLVGPGPALGAEHVAAHDGGADVLVGLEGEIVVDALAAAFSAEHRVEEPGGEGPVHELQAAFAEGGVESLTLGGAVTIQ